MCSSKSKSLSCAARRKKLDLLKDKAFKVKPGSILESDHRDGYGTHRFSFLREKRTSMGLE
jgi:hypothetical protein